MKYLRRVIFTDIKINIVDKELIEKKVKLLLYLTPRMSRADIEFKRSNDGKIIGIFNIVSTNIIFNSEIKSSESIQNIYNLMEEEIKNQLSFWKSRDCFF